MQNKLTDLNNHLFEQLERLNDQDLQGEDLDKEMARAKSICTVAAQIIANGNLLLNAKKHFDEYGNKVPELLRVGEKDEDV